MGQLNMVVGAIVLVIAAVGRGELRIRARRELPGIRRVSMLRRVAGVMCERRRLACR